MEPSTNPLPTAMTNPSSTPISWSGTFPHHYDVNLRRVQRGLRGTFAINTPSSDVYELTGQQPESFESIARRYVTRPNAQPTLANKFRVMRNFLKIVTTPAYDIDAYVRAMQFPIPPRPQYAIDSAIWRQEHHAPLIDVGQSTNETTPI